MLIQWKDSFLVVFESTVGGRKNVQCLWAPLWYGDAGRFFEVAFLFE